MEIWDADKGVKLGLPPGDRDGLRETFGDGIALMAGEDIMIKCGDGARVVASKPAVLCISEPSPRAARFSYDLEPMREGSEAFLMGSTRKLPEASRTNIGEPEWSLEKSEYSSESCRELFDTLRAP
jgi:hypothetical protein